MAFVCKQITINNIGQQQSCFSRLLAILPDCLYIHSFFSLEYFDSFDHYAACYVPLRIEHDGLDVECHAHLKEI